MLTVCSSHSWKNVFKSGCYPLAPVYFTRLRCHHQIENDNESTAPPTKSMTSSTVAFPIKTLVGMFTAAMSSSIPNQRCLNPDWPNEENVLASIPLCLPAAFGALVFVAGLGLDSDKFCGYSRDWFSVSDNKNYVAHQVTIYSWQIRSKRLAQSWHKYDR